MCFHFNQEVVIQINNMSKPQTETGNNMQLSDFAQNRYHIPFIAGRITSHIALLIINFVSPCKRKHKVCTGKMSQFFKFDNPI